MTEAPQLAHDAPQSPPDGTVQRPYTPEHTQAPQLAPEEARPEPTNNGNGYAHWVENPRIRSAFWAWVKDQDLTQDEVHAALGVEHVNEYAGTAQEAKAVLITASRVKHNLTPTQNGQAT